MTLTRDARLFFGYFFILCIAYAWAMYCDMGLLYDGAYYVIHNAFHGEVTLHGDLRDLAFYLLQTPAALYAENGGLNFAWSSFLFQAPHFAWPLLLVLIHWFILPKKYKYLAFGHLSILYATALFSFYFHVSEMNLSFGLACIAVGQIIAHKNAFNIILFVLFMILSNATYPTAALLTPVLIFAPLFIKNLKVLSIRNCIYTLTALSTLFFQIYAVSVYKELFAGNYSNFFNGIQSPHLIPYTLLIVTTLTLCLLIKKFASTKILTLAISTGFALYCFMFSLWFNFGTHFQGRALSTVICSLMLSFFIMSQKSDFLIQTYLKGLKTLVLASIPFLICFNIYFLKRKQGFVSFLNKNYGILTVDEAEALGLKAGFYTAHAFTQLSIIWQYDRKINSVILPSFEIGPSVRDIVENGELFGFQFSKQIKESPRY